MSSRFSITAVALGLVLALPVRADISSATSSIPNNFTSNLQLPNAAMAGNLYGGCFSFGNGNSDILTKSIVDLALGKDKKGDGDLGCGKIDASCSPDVGHSVPGCPAKGSDAFFNKLIGKTNTAKCCMDLKNKQLQEAASELSCINQHNDNLVNQIKSAQAMLQSQLQNAQKAVAQIDGVITDRVSQSQFIQSKLGGNKENGTSGLLDLQAQMQKVITGQLPGDVSGLEAQVTNYNQQQVLFQQRVSNQKMALAKQCFLSDDSGNQCSVNSTSTCSFAELIKAKYYELSRTVNGQVQRNNSTNKAQAQAKRAQLDALFKEIFSNISSDTKLAPTTETDMKNQQQAMGENYRVLTPQDLESNYGAKLSALNIPGLNVHDLFVNKFQYCYKQANSTVTQSMSNPASQYSMSVAGFQNMKKGIQDKFNVFYKGYGDMYTKFWSTMGVTAPLDTAKCSDPSTSFAGKMQCAKDLSTNLEGLYTGKGANSQVTVKVPGTSTNPITEFAFQCNGINGCVTAMQNAQTNLKNDLQHWEKVKKSNIQSANQQIENMKNQWQSVLAVQNKAMMDRLGTLKSILAKAGVQEPLSPRFIKPDAFKKGKYKDSQGGESDGLYEMPPDLLGALGGNMVLDPAGGGLDDAHTAIAGAIRRNERKEEDIVEMLADLKKQKEDCAAGKVDKLGGEASNAVANLINQCQNSTWLCPVNYSDPLSTLSDAINGISSDSDLKTDMITSLVNGRRGCSNASALKQRARAALEEACKLAAESCTSLPASCKGPVTPAEKKDNDCATYITQVNAAAEKVESAGVQESANVSCDKLSDKATKAVKDYSSAADRMDNRSAD